MPDFIGTLAFKLIVGALGLAVVVSAGFYIKSLRSDIALLEGQKKTLQTTNARLSDTIVEQEKNRTKENALMQGFVQRLAAIEQDSAKTFRKLSELERQNAEVKDYLNRNVPSDLSRLLNKNVRR